MKLSEYRAILGWSQMELARRAHLNPGTITKAERGEEISGSTATKISEALSDALGRRVLPGDIEDLRVKL
jgi:transcriptional regulator with XRE-family HTH domain